MGDGIDIDFEFLIGDSREEGAAGSRGWVFIILGK